MVWCVTRDNGISFVAFVILRGQKDRSACGKIAKESGESKLHLTVYSFCLVAGHHNAVSIIHFVALK